MGDDEKEIGDGFPTSPVVPHEDAREKRKREAPKEQDKEQGHTEEDQGDGRRSKGCRWCICVDEKKKISSSRVQELKDTEKLPEVVTLSKTNFGEEDLEMNDSDLKLTDEKDEGEKNTLQWKNLLRVYITKCDELRITGKRMKIEKEEAEKQSLIYKEVLEIYENQLDELKMREEKIIREKDEAVKLVVHLENMKLLKEEYETKVLLLKQELGIYKSKIDEMKSREEKMRMEKEDAEKMANRSKKLLGVYEAKFDLLSKRDEDLKMEREEAAKHVGHLEKELAIYQTKYDELIMKEEERNIHSGQLKKDFKVLESKYDELWNELEKKNKEIASLESNLSERICSANEPEICGRRFDELKQRLTFLEEELVVVDERERRAQEKVATLSEELKKTIRDEHVRSIELKCVKRRATHDANAWTTKFEELVTKVMLKSQVPGNVSVEPRGISVSCSKEGDKGDSGAKSPIERNQNEQNLSDDSETTRATYAENDFGEETNDSGPEDVQAYLAASNSTGSNQYPKTSKSSDPDFEPLDEHMETTNFVDPDFRMFLSWLQKSQLAG